MYEIKEADELGDGKLFGTSIFFYVKILESFMDQGGGKIEPFQVVVKSLSSVPERTFKEF